MRSLHSSFIFFCSFVVVGLVVVLWPAPRINAAPASSPLSQSERNLGELILEAEGQVPMPKNVPSAHASSLVALSSRHAGPLGIFWFAGTRESAPDVQIAFSFFDRAQQQWTAAKFVLNRHELGQQLGYGIRRLGNPVAWRDASDRLHLFVVGTGLGGWAAGRIIHLVQENDLYDLDKLHFQVKGVLPLSWLWNTSYLVRNHPVTLSDEGIVLPVHFEVGIKYPALLWFSSNGDFNGMRRISARPNLLQPAVLPVSDSHWVSFMRMKGGQHKVAKAESWDAGHTWQDAPDLNLHNPDASIAALRIADDIFVVAKNPSRHSRHELTLTKYHHSQPWDAPIFVEKGVPGDEYSYPSLQWLNDALWISYTDQRKGIAWQRYSALLPSTIVSTARTRQ